MHPGLPERQSSTHVYALRPVAVLIGASLACLGILPEVGCIAVGDGQGVYRMRGKLVDACTREPISGARIWAPDYTLTLDDDGRGLPKPAVASVSASDGAFAINAAGSFSCGWFLIVPLGDRTLPFIDKIRLEVEHEGQTGSTVLHPPWYRQPLARGGRRIELGAVPITLEAAPAGEPTIAGNPEKAR
jgi:hypothetical protein